VKLNQASGVDLTRMIKRGRSVYHSDGTLLGTVSKDAEEDGLWVRVPGSRPPLFFKPHQIASVDEAGNVHLKPIVDLTTLVIGSNVFGHSHDLVGTVSEVSVDKASIEREGNRSASFRASDIVQVDGVGNVHLNEEWTAWLADADAVQPRLEAYGTESGTRIIFTHFHDLEL